MVQGPQLWASQSLVLLVLVRTDLRTTLWASHTIRTQRSLRTHESVPTVKLYLALVTHCSLDDQVLRDTADIKQSQRNQSQRCHTFKLLSRAKAPADSISHLNGGKMFPRSTGNKNKGDEIDYFTIRFFSGSMDGSEGMALATKTDDLNLVPGTQMVGENTDSMSCLWPEQAGQMLPTINTQPNIII